MDISLLVKGLILGFSIAAPVGPIGILCIQRTTAYGFKSGLATGLGASTADGLYGAAAAFGLTVISTFLTKQQFSLKFIGGAFLLYLGLKMFFSKPAKHLASMPRKNLLSDYVSTFFLTLANPMTMISFAAVFAGLGVFSQGFGSACLMVMGVFLGSALWWFVLSCGVASLEIGSNANLLKAINKISGSIIILFAIFSWAGVLKFFKDAYKKSQTA
jgi:threonine/homoserine/homoserine lactone efflux protein